MAKEATAQAAQNKLPLFYQEPAPLDSKAHARLALRKDFDLGYAAKVNAVPVNLIEMPQLCHYYPIAFSNDGSATPVAILGLRESENLFVNDQGRWEDGTYVPAYIRRYPFIFSEIPGNNQLSLCVDMDQRFVEEGGEQRFFDDEGKPTLLSQNALEFCKSYHAAAQPTMEFSKVLQDSGLLIDRQVDLTLPDGKKISFAGFRIIDEARLAEIKDETFAEWRRKGWLPFIYAHLFSGAQWQRLTGLLNRRINR